MKILITSGGTKVMLDGVRNISNMSKGTFGSSICKAFLEKGHNVDFLMAEGSRTPFELKMHINSMDDLEGFAPSKYAEFVGFNYRCRDLCSEFKYKTFDDYKEQIEALLKYNSYDIVVLAAAVSDFGVENAVKGKIRSKEDLNIVLKPLPKIISEIKKVQPTTFLVGFKLLVDSNDTALINEAEMSIEKNGCELVVANDLRDIKQDNHRLLVVTKEYCGNDEFLVKQITKNEAESYGITLADALVDRILTVFERNNLINQNKNV